MGISLFVQLFKRAFNENVLSTRTLWLCHFSYWALHENYTKTSFRAIYSRKYVKWVPFFSMLGVKLIRKGIFSVKMVYKSIKDWTSGRSLPVQNFVEQSPSPRREKQFGNLKRLEPCSAIPLLGKGHCRVLRRVSLASFSSRSDNLGTEDKGVNSNLI